MNLGFPQARKIQAQTVSSQLVSVKALPNYTGPSYDYWDVVYDDTLELKPGQEKFIEYLAKIYKGASVIFTKILKNGVYEKSDIGALNKYREKHLLDYIQYKNDKLQKIQKVR